jgi:hypothetical protein
MNEFAGQLQRGVLSRAENTLQSPASQSALDLQGSPGMHLRPAFAPHVAVVLLLLLLLLTGVEPELLLPGCCAALLLLLLTSSDASTQLLPVASGTCCRA